MADERGAVIVYPEKRYIGDADLQALLAAHGVTVSLEEIKRKAGRVWNVVPSGNNWREALDHYGITYPVAAIKDPADDGIETSGFPAPFRFRVRRMVRRLFVRAQNDAAENDRCRRDLTDGCKGANQGQQVAPVAGSLRFQGSALDAQRDNPRASPIRTTSRR